MVDIVVIAIVILAAIVIILAADARRRARLSFTRRFATDDSKPLRTVVHPEPHLLHDERPMKQIISEQGDRYWK